MSTTSFSNYVESGANLLTGTGTEKLVGTFRVEHSSSTIVNTLRRCILMDVRSVGFRVDLTQSSNPGIVFRKNTSVIVNEMLAHRITMIPVAIRQLDSFDPSEYQCVLQVKNSLKDSISEKTIQHITTNDFKIVRKQGQGQGQGQEEVLGVDATLEMFPPDPITGQNILIVSLRPQWNPDQPPEEIDLTAYPVIGTGRDHMGFCPVSQCSFENMPDTDPSHQEAFFTRWLLEYKKITDAATVPPDQIASLRREWSTLAIQRCFLVNEKGEPDSFNFTVESIGVRSVPEIVIEGIQAVIDLVTPYENITNPADVGITIQPSDSRMVHGADVLFAEQEHTLGVLLQSLITELFLDTLSDSPLTSVGYKVPHPLERIMKLRLGFRTEVTETDVIQIISAAATKAKDIFTDMKQSWISLTTSKHTA